ncbi:endonuclease/exonuclease/phosphatase family protein [Sediminicola sp. 1XM1-17]|uniref:endonuclease/exonuclease/phosphatase family protein n=1 Tax=Sediminicola sp. 1XM1-17 TaxID=3127702 RepID=UPI003077AD34
MLFTSPRSNTTENLYTVAFYNLENLFDIRNNDHILDEGFTPNGIKKWTPKRYQKKIVNLGRAISRIGEKFNQHPPVLVGLSEVENGLVLNDLIQTDSLKKTDYGYVHFDSPDERGIDTALLYRKRYFNVIRTEAIPLDVYSLEGVVDRTRDILYVFGTLNGEEVHLFINHWPSRREGGVATAYKRMHATNTILQYMAKLEESHQDPNYIVMGDFNDDPSSESMQHLVASKQLYNPMEKMHSPFRGSAQHKRQWNLFDQIIVSHNFFNYEKGTHSFAHANIFDEHFLKEDKGRYKGSPLRTFVGNKYKGGYSDHFPVYIQLKYNT